MNSVKNHQLVVWMAMAGSLLAAFVWAYWTTFEELAATWSRDPNYSQGYLVPLFALAILWHRCRTAKLAWGPPDPWGLGLLLLATALRLAGAYFYVTPLDHLSLILVCAGACLLLGGRTCLERAWSALVLLLFMFPIPRSLGGSQLISGLQEAATMASTFTLQTLGVVAQREGNIIVLKGCELGIVEACSGLRMLMVFCALSTATAFLLPYGWKRRTILVVSAVPLALASNVARITAAGLASEALSSEVGHFVFHDLAGWLMVPLAFCLLGAELWLLSWLFQPVSPSAPSPHLPMLVAGSRPSRSTAKLVDVSHY
jgi:exosortase